MNLKSICECETRKKIEEDARQFIYCTTVYSNTVHNGKRMVFLVFFHIIRWWQRLTRFPALFFTLLRLPLNISSSQPYYDKCRRVEKALKFKQIANLNREVKKIRSSVELFVLLAKWKGKREQKTFSFARRLLFVTEEAKRVWIWTQSQCKTQSFTTAAISGKVAIFWHYKNFASKSLALCAWVDWYGCSALLSSSMYLILMENNASCWIDYLNKWKIMLSRASIYIAPKNHFCLEMLLCAFSWCVIPSYI